MITYALDTNIISYMLKGDVQISTSFRQENNKGNIFIIPVAVYYEIRRGLLAVNATAQMQAFKKLCDSFDVEEMNIDSWEEAANIWASLKRSGTTLGKDDGDIFIAAHCIINNYTLVTANISDFARINGLKLVNWR